MASVFSSVLGKLFILLLKDDPFEADLGVGGFFVAFILKVAIDNGKAWILVR